MKGRRSTYLLILLILVILGPFVRSLSTYLPDFLNLYLGDIIYAMAAFFGFAILLNNKSGNLIAILAFAFCVLIELSQLYHAPWIDHIRATRIGGYVLGFGFLWSDLLAYVIGVCFGLVIERLMGRSNN